MIFLSPFVVLFLSGVLRIFRSNYEITDHPVSGGMPNYSPGLVGDRHSAIVVECPLLKLMHKRIIIVLKAIGAYENSC